MRNRLNFQTLAFVVGSVALIAPGGSLRAQTDLEKTFQPGQSFTLEGQKLFVEKIAAGKLILAPPAPPTQSLGAFITPVDATASSSQDGVGRTPSKTIDGSGWGESFPGSGVYVHTSDVYTGGSSMWNGAGNTPAAWVVFDLGKPYRVAGTYVWNYNEGTGYAARSVKDMTILSSSDGKAFVPVGDFTLTQASGTDDEKGQAVAFQTPVIARYFKFDIKSNYKSNDVSGLSEVRFANADVKAPPPGLAAWKPTYPRPIYPKLAQGQPLVGAENIAYPADMGIVDVSKAPYNAKGDGVTDDTAAIQKALNDHPNQGAIIYLPNGIYRLTDTLRWPSVGGDDNTIKNTVLQGQSRGGAVLQLPDHCPGFANVRKPRALLWTGHAPAQRFGNEIHNLTVDTGVGNPGACGIQFMANNQGGISDVTIQSGDGQGAVGLDMAYTDEEGPLLIKNVKIQGFDVGVAAATSLASETMEHVTVAHQNVCGIRNAGQPLSVRDLQSVNSVPAVINSGGLLTLIDAKLTGEGGGQPAILNEAGLLARNIHASGYAAALHDKVSGKNAAGPDITEFRSEPPQTLLSAGTKTLGLPVRDTPELPWDDPKTWVSPLKFGVKPGDGQDASAAIQQAIDSGATTVYLPRGEYHIAHTITLRGNVRRFLGGKAYLTLTEPLKSQNQPVFRFADGSAPTVILEGLSTDFSNGPFFFLENASKRTLVMRRLLINFQGPPAYRNTDAGTGPLFLEDIVGQAFFFKNQTVWARQFNPELNFHPGLHVQNDGGTLWALGFKTEGGGTQIETRNGGRTEILGGLVGDTNAGKMAPMFVNDASQMSVAVAEVCFNHDPFDKLAQETRGGQTKTWRKDEALSGMRLVIYEGHADAKSGANGENK